MKVFSGRAKAIVHIDRNPTVRPGLVPVGHPLWRSNLPCSRLGVVALGVDLPHRVAHQEGYEEREGNQLAKSLMPSLSLVTLKFKSSPILRGPSGTCVGSPPAQD